jgi:hypothetical protein
MGLAGLALLEYGPDPRSGSGPDVFYEDGFDQSAAVRLTAQFGASGQMALEPSSGEYVIRLPDQAAPDVSVQFSLFARILTDVRIAVDARVEGDQSATEVMVYCRVGVAPNRNRDPRFGSYALSVSPHLRQFSVLAYRERQIRRQDFPLGAASAAIRTGNAVNRLDLGCIGDRITAAINGQQVFSGEDSVRVSGHSGIGAMTRSAARPEARFDNLKITSR